MNTMIEKGDRLLRLMKKFLHALTSDKWKKESEEKVVEYFNVKSPIFKKTIIIFNKFYIYEQKRVSF